MVWNCQARQGTRGSAANREPNRRHATARILRVSMLNRLEEFLRRKVRRGYKSHAIGAASSRNLRAKRFLTPGGGRGSHPSRLIGDAAGAVWKLPKGTAAGFRSAAEGQPQRRRSSATPNRSAQAAQTARGRALKHASQVLVHQCGGVVNNGFQHRFELDTTLL